MSHLHHKVSALVDGELHGSARRRALNHARHCDDCRHELEATVALKRRMAGLSTEEPSADLFSSLDLLTLRGERHLGDRAPHLAAARTRLGPVVRRILVGAGSLSVAVLSVAYVVGAPADVATGRLTPPLDEYAADFAGNTGLAPLADPAVEALAGSPQPIAQVVAAGEPPAALASYPQSLSHGDDIRAVKQLERSVSAPNHFAYTGIRQIETFDAGPPTTLRLGVEHTPGQGTTFDVVNGSSVATATFIAARDRQVSGSLDSAPLELLVNAYDLAVVSSATILGRSATVIEARRDGVVSARFWIDDVTGLLLRREMYDGGRVVRMTGFTELRVTRDGFLPHLPPELEAPPTTRLPIASAPVLNDDGWSCPGTLPADFALTGLDRLEIDADVMRASYSDGLSTVSVFEQRGSLDQTSLSGMDEASMAGGKVFVSYGLPTVAVWESGGTVYTVVTDAPHDAAAAVIRGLPHSRLPSSGTGNRIVTGLDRIATFINPAQ